MKRLLLGIAVVLAAAGTLVGCAGIGGRGRGPVDAFVFSTARNPELRQDAVGVINEQTEPKEISLVVPPGTDATRLVATLSLSREASVSVVSSGQKVLQQNGVTPNDFSVPVSYSVEVAGDKKPWLYKVLVRETDTNARLSRLVFPEGSAIALGFDPAVDSYTVTVPFATTRIRIEARAQSPYARSVTVAGVQTPGPAGAAVVDFAALPRTTVTVEVLAEDGMTGAQYAVAVVRGAPDSNTLLDAMEIQNAPLVPAFSPARLSYQAQVPFETRQIVLRARPKSQWAGVDLSAAGGLRFQGDPASRAGAVVEFTAGARLSLAATVTAQDGSTQQYLVEILRAEPDRNNLLVDLAVAGVRLSPAFSANVLNYVADVPFASTQLTITARPQSRTASLALEPVLVSTRDQAVKLAFTGELAARNGATADFRGGDVLFFAVAVTAQDGNVLRYVVQARRTPPDRNADLGALAVSPGALSPGFAPRTAAYTVTLPGTADAVRLTASPSSPRASVAIDAQLPGKPGAAQAATVAVPPGGAVSVGIAVTAEDGSRNLYRVQVMREAPPAPAADSNSRLAFLQAAGAALQPAFSPTVTSYDARIGAAVDSVVVAAGAESPAANVSMDGQPLGRSGRAVPVAEGTTRVVQIVVTAESGAASRYALRITREAAGAKPPEAKPTETKPPETRPIETKPPAKTGSDVVLVSAKNLRIEKREAAALSQAGESIGTQARITTRYYRSSEIIVQEAARVEVRQQGANTSVSFEYRSAGVALDRARMVEIEVAIPTSAGHFLFYTEADPAGAVVNVEVPFLLYGSDPQVAWPALGSSVKVAGYLSASAAGKEKGERESDKEDFARNDKGEYGIAVELFDAKTGRSLGKDTVWTKPGLARGRTFTFGKAILVPEGGTVRYALTAEAKNGRSWQASGTAQAWTTRLEYSGGFAAVVLSIADELAASDAEPKKKP